MSELAQTLTQLVVVLGRLIADLFWLALAHWVLLVWVAWWLGGVNWQKLWPVLARGAWAPVALLGFIAALVWSRIEPSTYDLLGLVTLPNFWYQLTAVGLLVALTLFCGWLQGMFGWTPPEIQLEPATVHHAHAPEPVGAHGPESGEAHAVEEHGHH